MGNSIKQKTLKSEVSLKDFGLHTGKEVTMTLKPAPINTGFVFIRTDIDGNPKVEVDATHVVNTNRGTNLKDNNVEIQTPEHVLAALVGCDIDNVYIELNSPELPIMDGSSKFFVDAIEKGGIVEQNANRTVYVVTEPISYIGENGSELTIVPHDKYSVEVEVNYETKILGVQYAELNDITNFKKEISCSRTFCFLHELEYLLDADLVKGGALKNAIVYVDKDISEATQKKLIAAFGQDDVKVTPGKILNNLTLHHPNEAARHKLLDVIGDLALIGVKLQGKIIAKKPGHKVNTEFARKLSQIIKQK